MDQIEQTPTQKARQLVERFYFALPNNGSQTGINNVHSRWEEAKMCAKITIEQMKTSLFNADLMRMHDYWTEVKTEIEKL
jgi:hypothetical protein